MQNNPQINEREIDLEVSVDGKPVFQKYSSFPGTFVFTKNAQLTPTRALIGRKGTTQLDSTSVYLFEIPFQYLPLFWILVTIIVCTFIVSFLNFLFKIASVIKKGPTGSDQGKEWNT